ncbi:hypothetical protein A9P82_12710 [Arachidicoccus ginsenosidimutans]|uniref:glycoside hydrolase family 76 protein n=1 Tax=Arachidicoccus sp. BS20 TaxID=1850526 RepID=UPI0007F17B31|nr:glycoside hydrolase family 76 protein [Arachidicoccus sp. BS20]ANI90069.1 hypothetical protein A9P82_12710 [Arachidicoccus sp. BS20]
MKKHIFFIFLLFAGYSQNVVNAQAHKYDNAARALEQKIQQYFYRPDINYYRELPDTNSNNHKVAFLWSMGALWQADNEMENAGIAAGLLKKDIIVIEKYFDAAPPAQGYDSYPSEFGKEDRYYDDNQWLGLTAIDAYFRTKDKFYLDFGEKIYRFMMTGYDTVSGGGLYWKEGDKTTKNTCSNGPGIVLALKLYKATHNKNYLDTALILYKWVNKHLQISDGLYYDNLNVQTGKVATWQFSYNTGTMLQSNILLYDITKNKKYLKEANRIALAAKDYFYGSGKFRDDYWFNAVLLRAYQQLLDFNPDKQYINAFKACLDNALQTNQNANGLMGKEKLLNLVGQGGMLEILARFAAMESK